MVSYFMKVKCIFDGIIIECKVVEDMGYQDGSFVKAVEFNNTERIVVKISGDIYRPREARENLENTSNHVEQ